MPPGMPDAVTLLSQVAAGIGLAACAGLRAFLPLLAVGVAARAGLMTLPQQAGWLADTPALMVLAIAALVELAADKVPVVDHLLDVAGTVLRPAIGALAGVAPLAAWAVPMAGAEGERATAWTLLALVAGGGAAIGLGVHALKATLRVAGSALTGGAANPVASLAEDAVSLLGVLLSVLLPLLAVLGLAALAGAAALFWMRTRRHPGRMN